MGEEERKNWSERKIERTRHKLDQPDPYYCYYFGYISEFNLLVNGNTLLVWAIRNTFPNTAKLPELIIDQTDNIQRTQTRVHIITPYRTFQQTQTVSIILENFFIKLFLIGLRCLKLPFAKYEIAHI